MPTVLRQDGFRVMIHTDDHPPAHVHCIKAGAVVRIAIETAEVIDNYAMSKQELRRAVELVKSNQDYLMAEWRRVFPQ